jgi:hypothetical protein
VPISRVGAVTLATATVTGWTCAIPAGVQDNDVLYAVVCKGTNAALTLPSGQGYTAIGAPDAGGTTIYMWCYTAVLQAADAGTNHVWAWASARAGACALILRGCDAGQPLDVTSPPGGNSTNATTVTCPATTFASAGAWVIWASAAAATATHAFPATVDGFTTTREAGSVAGANGLAWATYPAGATTTAPTVTLSVTGRTIGKTLVARPAPIPSVTQRWSGSAWVPAATQRWSGSAWVPATVKRWNGTGWV